MQAMNTSQIRTSRGLITLLNTVTLKIRRDGLLMLHSIDEGETQKSHDCLIQLVRNAPKGNELTDVNRERLNDAVRESLCREPAKFLEDC